MNPDPEPTKAANLPLGKLLPQPKGKLKDQFHEVARFRHLSPRTGRRTGRNPGLLSESLWDSPDATLQEGK
ncbi:MAG: hypothetical protein HOP33_15915 [Verrucomicrobia bacterium]|nr:hypothetical protein [Verrucomicrobiota bacterium]